MPVEQRKCLAQRILARGNERPEQLDITRSELDGLAPRPVARVYVDELLDHRDGGRRSQPAVGDSRDQPPCRLVQLVLASEREEQDQSCAPERISSSSFFSSSMLPMRIRGADRIALPAARRRAVSEGTVRSI